VRISELIERLEEIKKEHGNLLVVSTSEGMNGRFLEDDLKVYIVDDDCSIFAWYGESPLLLIEY